MPPTVNANPVMKPTLYYRAASLVLFLFAAGHTYGFLSFVPPTAEGVAVHRGMEQVRFRVGGMSVSYGGFYVGFGLFVGMSFVLLGLLAWWGGFLARNAPRQASVLGSMLFIYMCGSLALCCLYFPGPPLVLSATIVALLAVATLLSLRPRSGGRPPAGH